MRTMLRGKVTLLFITLGLLLAIPAIALASDLTGSVVDITAPEGSVTLSPGNSGNIEIRWSVTGKQDGTATFKVYKDWTLSGGTFTGSNPETVTVPARPVANAAATTGTVNGTVSVASSGQAAGGPFTLTVDAFDITNTNTEGAKLGAKGFSTYQVTVQAASDPCASVSTPDAPVITANPDTEDGNSGWYKSIPTVSAASATSGATITYATEVNGGPKSSFSSTPPTLGQGTTIVYAKATSATCNKVSESSRTFMVDTVAPSIGDSGSWTQVLPGNARTPDGTDPWYVTQVFNKFTASDATSGLANPATDAVFTKGSGLQEGDKVKINSGLISDVAGNSSSRDSAEYKIDLKNPSIVAKLVDADGIDLDPASTGWYNSDTGAPKAHYDCDDVDGDGVLANGGASGILSCTADSLPFGDGADQSHQGTATDNAGRTANASVTNVDVDLTPPNVSLVGGPADGVSYVFGTVPAAPTCDADDATSGLASCQVTGYGTTVGSHTVTATATDNAGNVNTASSTYTVDPYTLNGFFQPVDMGIKGNTDLGTYSGTATPNSARAGQTVPLKFEIFQGSTELTDTSAVKTFVQKVTCGALAGQVDAIETYSTGSTTLRYDFTSGQYIFNWQTPKTAGDCYKVTMTAQDNSFLTAYFTLKK